MDTVETTTTTHRILVRRCKEDKSTAGIILVTSKIITLHKENVPNHCLYQWMEQSRTLYKPTTTHRILVRCCKEDKSTACIIGGHIGIMMDTAQRHTEKEYEKVVKMKNRMKEMIL
eukprot:490687_1